MDPTTEQIALMLAHVAMGASLAACAGLRAFLPLFVVGLAGRLELIPLTSNFDWLASTPSLTVFGAAVVLELLGDKIPVVDHVLDAMQTFVKPAAGAAVMASVVGDWSPLMLTVVWIATGGALAGLVHLGKAKLRLASSLTTAGIGNPAISVAEDGIAATGAVVAVAAPWIAVVLLTGLVVSAWMLARGLRRWWVNVPRSRQSSP